MKFIKEHKILFILISIFALLLLMYLLREFIASREIYNESYLDGEDYIMNPKTYGVNEYSLVNIDDEQMCNIYLNDYKNKLSDDINYAYQLLNEEYRNKKFGSIENFINYVNNFDFSGLNIYKYSINSDKSIYKIYTENNNTFIFKVNSVMEYEVYLDDYTVEI